MSNKFTLLRNRVYSDAFRFDLDNDLWKMHYPLGEKEGLGRTIEVSENGLLKGYAIYSIEHLRGTAKVYRVFEIQAENREIFAELTQQLVERAVQDEVDFIYTKGNYEKFHDVFEERGFISFLESVIMVVLLNPIELFSSISEEVNQGKTLKIVIDGFDPILLRVGEKEIMVVQNDKPNWTVTIDSKTFLKLLFGKTSFLTQFIKGKIKIDSVLGLQTAMHLFGLIRQKSWYIPLGDWL